MTIGAFGMQVVALPGRLTQHFGMNLTHLGPLARVALNHIVSALLTLTQALPLPERVCIACLGDLLDGFVFYDQAVQHTLYSGSGCKRSSGQQKLRLPVAHAAPAGTAGWARGQPRPV